MDSMDTPPYDVTAIAEGRGKTMREEGGETGGRDTDSGNGGSIESVADAASAGDDVSVTAGTNDAGQTEHGKSKDAHGQDDDDDDELDNASLDDDVTIHNDVLVADSCECDSSRDSSLHNESDDVASLEYDDELDTTQTTPTSVMSSTYGMSSTPTLHHSSDGDVGNGDVTSRVSSSPPTSPVGGRPSDQQLRIKTAHVTGFRTVKPQGSLEAGEKPEYVFIVEVEWSDGRTNCVKRTYDDFCAFHCYLLDEFARLAENESSSEGMRMNLYLPLRTDGSECDLNEAEKRELQLNKYVQDLVKLPEKLSASPTVLTFFESRNSDPKPYKEVQAMDMAKFNNSNHYVICWISE